MGGIDLLLVDEEVPQAERASESNHRLLRYCKLEAICGVEDTGVKTHKLHITVGEHFVS